MSTTTGEATGAPSLSRRRSAESIGLVALVLLAPATLIYLSFNAGGYFPSAPGFAAIVLAQALVLRTTLAARPFEGFSRTLAVPLAALALYAALQLASALWSHATARTLDSYDRTLLYVLALVLFGSLRYTRGTPRLARAGAVRRPRAVCLIGLISRALPHTWPTASSFFDDRLNYPLTYWNAEGMIAAMALILGFHLAADRSRALERARARSRGAARGRGDPAADVLARGDGCRGHRPARLLPADPRQHAAERAARGRRAHRRRAALGVGRDRAGLHAPDQPDRGLPGSARGGGGGAVHARCWSAARGAAARRRAHCDARARARSSAPSRARRRGRKRRRRRARHRARARRGRVRPPRVRQVRPRQRRPADRADSRTALGPRQRRPPAAVEGRRAHLRNTEAARHRRGHLPALLPPLSHRTGSTSPTRIRCTCRAWPSSASSAWR